MQFIYGYKVARTATFLSYWTKQQFGLFTQAEVTNNVVSADSLWHLELKMWGNIVLFLTIETHLLLSPYKGLNIQISNFVYWLVCF